jgi:hypothetical protein
MGQEQSTLDPAFRLPPFDYSNPSYHQEEVPDEPEEEVIDIYDTGVSAGLRALLATLHQDDDLIAAPSTASTLSAFPKLSPSFVPTAARWNAQAPEFVPTSVPNAPMAHAEMKTWWYKDPKGISRGAFSTAEMKTWFDQKYFPADLFVARDEFGPYMPIAALDSQTPFAVYIDVRDFNLKLQAYL